MEMFLEHIFSESESSDKIVYMHEHLCFILQQRPKSNRNLKNVTSKFWVRAASYSGKYPFLLTQRNLSLYRGFRTK